MLCNYIMPFFSFGQKLNYHVIYINELLWNQSRSIQSSNIYLYIHLMIHVLTHSLIQFFNKIKNWMEMAAMSTDFKDRISHLEHKFAVSTVLFRKFQPIFQEIFSGLTNEPMKNNTKSKKPKWVVITVFAT